MKEQTSTIFDTAYLTVGLIIIVIMSLLLMGVVGAVRFIKRHLVPIKRKPKTRKK